MGFMFLRESITAHHEAAMTAVHSCMIVLLCYPGLHGLHWNRIAQVAWQAVFYLPTRLFAQFKILHTDKQLTPAAHHARQVGSDRGSGMAPGGSGWGVSIYHPITPDGTSVIQGRPSGATRPAAE